MARIVRMISEDGTVTITGIDSFDIVSHAAGIHRTSAVTTAALGRLLTAASMMGTMLKGEQDTITLRLSGEGPASPVIAVSDSHGNVKGYIGDGSVEFPLNDKGKLDVAAAVGKTGTLSVIKDLGMKEPYIGQVPLVSGEIAEDITYYYATSEQTPTVCALGVLVAKGQVVAAGGYIIHILPFYDEDILQKVEASIGKMPPVTTLMAEGKQIEEILRMALSEFQLEILDESFPAYQCDCSRERVEKALISLGKKELSDMIEEGKPIEVNCHFCNKIHRYNTSELSALLGEKER